MLHQLVEYSCVAVTANPFGMFDELLGIQGIRYPQTAISAPGTKNGLHLRCVQSPLEVSGPLSICAGKLVAASVQMWSC